MKYLAKTFFFLGLLFFSCDEYKWTFEFGNDSGKNQAKLVHKNDTDYYVLGNNNFDSEKSQSIILKLNSEGKNEWQYVFKDPTNYENIIDIADFAISADGTIYATGSQWLSKDNISQAVMFKIKNGKLLEKKVFKTHEKIDRVIIKKNKVTVLASTYDYKNIISMNSDFSENWNKNYHISTSNDYLNYSDNFFYFLTIKVYPYEINLAKLSLNGLLIWDRSYKLENLGEIYEEIKKNPSKFFLPDHLEIIDKQIIITGYNRLQSSFKYLTLDCENGNIIKAVHSNLDNLKIDECSSKFTLLKSPSYLLNRRRGDKSSNFESLVVFKAFNKINKDVCYCNLPKFQDEKFGINDFIVEDSLFVGFKVINSNYDQKWKIDKY